MEREYNSGIDNAFSNILEHPFAPPQPRYRGTFPEGPSNHRQLKTPVLRFFLKAFALRYLLKLSQGYRSNETYDVMSDSKNYQLPQYNPGVHTFIWSI